jgi:hypothetical protein
MSVAWYCQDNTGRYLTGQFAAVGARQVVVVDDVDHATRFPTAEDAARFAAAAPFPGFAPVPHVSHRSVR